MSEQEIAQKLEKLAVYRARYNVLQVEKQSQIDKIMNAEIQEKLAQIDITFKTENEAIDNDIIVLEDEIKQDVLAYGSSVKGLHLHAIWSKGRVSWDTKSLDGYATAHPELLPFRKEGEPSVSIRSAK